MAVKKIANEDGKGNMPTGPKLIIVESPAKARTIEKYLGKDFQVKASMGHIIDLPSQNLGIDTEQNFEPVYKTIKGKSKVVKEIRDAAAKASAVYLAPDPDREGEAIAWHISNVIGERSDVYRVLFNEITKRGVTQAMDAPGQINMDLVDSYQARRVLDRMVGYMVSPFLWKTVTRGLSAGRVQTVALRLLSEREAEIEAFDPQEYWTVEGVFERDSGENYSAALDKVDGEKLESVNSEDAARYVEMARTARFEVAAVQRRKKRRQPAPPFITSTIQQDASRRFGYSASRTMRLAQRLYEGMELPGEEAAGLITYMRTDSTRVSQDALDESRAWIGENEPGLLPEAARIYKSRKSAQDGHEAIRPTSVARHPDQLKAVLDRDLWRLYDLVWRRFVASQCNPAVYDTTSVAIEGDGLTFRASGSVLRDPGFTKVYPLASARKTGGSDASEDKDELLPDIEEGENAKLDSVEGSQHFTKPPPRFTEASIVKEMEAQGIGRPSTYAATLKTLIDRNYVSKEKRTLFPSDLGRDVTRILTNAFSEIFEVGFTASMEDKLDEVEQGTKEWRRLVKDFYDPFSSELDNAMEKRLQWKALIEEESGEHCPTCERVLIKKWGRHGRFLACSGFPECSHSQPLGPAQERVKSEEPCGQCQAEMVLRDGRFGRFWSCSTYPECKETLPFLIGVACPQDGCDEGQLTEKKGKRGRMFYSCHRYPDCKYTSWDKPLARPCESCGAPFLVERKGEAICPNAKCAWKPDAEAEMAG